LKEVPDWTVNRRLALLSIVTLWIVPPLAVSLMVILSGLPAVLETGMCPAAPTDIPAYPCSAYDYLARMTVGPWALAGHIAIASAWTVCLGAALALAVVWRIARKPLRANPRGDNPGSRRLT
jgi:hypothetical protein